MTADERTELLAQLAHLQERLAAYIEVVGDVVERLGHKGISPDDLRDAIGEIEGMLGGTITTEPHELTGIAEQVRLALQRHNASATARICNAIVQRNLAEQ